MKTKLGWSLTMLLMLFAEGCGNSQLVTQSQPQGSLSQARTFALAGDFPADIVIPDIEGMRSTAFVVSTSDPAAILPIDIDADPMQLSESFPSLTVPQGAGIPSRLLIAALDRAFLLTSNAIIAFDPQRGTILDMESVIASIDIGEGLQNSDGSPAASSIVPNYPGGIAYQAGTLFISSANYLQTQTPAVCAPGTIQLFAVESGGTLRFQEAIVTSGSNPTELAIRNARELIAVNSGVIDIVDAGGVPQTDASMDIIDLDSLSISATIELGLAAPSPHGMVLTYDASRAFLGSAAFGEVYEIDLLNRQLLRGRSDPIVANSGADYITSVALSVDNLYLYAASFEQSAVIPFELSTTVPTPEDPFVVGFPAGVTDQNPSGANTGAGPIAVRPGSRGIDYEGEDLFVLTGYPGTLVAIDSGAPAQAFAPETSDVAGDDTPPPLPPKGDAEDPCQGFVQAIASVTYGAGAGFGQSSLPDIVLGPPRGMGELLGSTHVLSLGSGGEIVLDLGTCPAVDGPGDDFIVFENAFYIGGNRDAPFAEPARISVSEDGIDFTPYPCSLEAPDYQRCAGSHPVFAHPENSIDPFDPIAAGGEAFDLQDVGLSQARFIKITDVGNGGAGGSAGFDLDAIAVINGEIQ